MKSMRKVLIALMVVVLLAAALPTTAFAADYTGYPGDEVTVVIPLVDDTNGQGKIAFSGDTDSFTFEVVEQVGNVDMTYNPDNGKFSYAHATTIADSAITVKVTIKDSAQAGDSCTITVSDYLYGLDLESYAPAAKTVEVVAEPTEEPTPTPDEVTPTPDPGLDEQPPTGDSGVVMFALLAGFVVVAVLLVAKRERA